MEWNWVIPGLVITAVLLSGCSGSNQDEDFKKLVSTVAEDFKDQKELILKPYNGLTPDQLYQYKSAASSAIDTAESMTLSDTSLKARGLFIQGMNATISAVDTLEQAGKLKNKDERVPTDSVNSYFIATQTKIDDACSLINVERDKSF